MAGILSLLNRRSEGKETAENPVRVTLDGIDTSGRLTGIETSLRGLKEVLLKIEDNTHDKDDGKSVFRDFSDKVSFQRFFQENKVYLTPGRHWI